MKHIIATAALICSALMAANVDIQNIGYYRGAPVISTVSLPKPVYTSYSFEKLLSSRGQKVELTTEQIRSEQLGQILWAGYGVTNSQSGTRTVASFDEGYSLLLYIVTSDSVYVYVPADHSLAKIMDSDMRSKLAVAANRDKAVYIGGASIVVAGSPNKAGFKQPRNSRMFMLFEAGRVAQNMEIAAMTQNLGFIINEKIDSSKITSLFRMPSGFETICIMTIGRLTEGIDAAAAPQPAAQATTQTVAENTAAQALKPITETAPTKPEAQPAAVEQKEKRVLVYVPGRNFPEQAFTEITRLLKLSGAKVEVAGTTLDKMRGDLSSDLYADVLIRNAASDYDALIILGGNVSSRPIDKNNTPEELAARIYNKGGIVAAFGRGTEILAKSGLLANGVRVTGDSSLRRTISQNGGTYVNDPVAVDGRIITARDSKDGSLSNLQDGPVGSVGLAEAVINAMKEKQ